MNLARKLTAAIALYCVLGMTVATAQVKAPYNCPGAGPCPCDELCQLQYRLMQIHNVSTTNSVLTRTQPTKAQMQQAALDIENYVSTNIKNGNMGQMQQEMLTLLNDGTYQSMSFSATYGQKLSASFGGIMTVAQLQAEINNVTQADRQAAAAYIKTYGLPSYMDSAAALLNEMGAEEGVHSQRWLNITHRIKEVYHKLGFLPPVDLPHAWLDGCVTVGTALMIFGGPVGEAIGGGMLIGAGLGALYIDIWG